MRTESRVGFIVGLVIFLNVIAYTQSIQECQIVKLPANIEMSDGLAQLLQKIYLRSDAFRAQCERIAAATNLHVTIQLSHAIPRSCLAYTKVRRRSGVIRADVYVPLANILFAEIIGHEFEHIVEQIDGLNLRALARTRGSGVHEVEREIFETERAKQAGRIVADEAARRIGRALNIRWTMDDGRSCSNAEHLDHSGTR